MNNNELFAVTCVASTSSSFSLEECSVAPFKYRVILPRRDENKQWIIPGTVVYKKGKKLLREPLK